MCQVGVGAGGDGGATGVEVPPIVVEAGGGTGNDADDTACIEDGIVE